MALKLSTPYARSARARRQRDDHGHGATPPGVKKTKRRTIKLAKLKKSKAHKHN